MTQKYKEMDKLKTFLDANKWSTAEFAKNLINCEDIFESCWWSMERIDCAKSIKPSYTSYGLCCSFNYFLDNYVKSPKQVSRLYSNNLRNYCINVMLISYDIKGSTNAEAFGIRRFWFMERLKTRDQQRSNDVHFRR